MFKLVLIAIVCITIGNNRTQAFDYDEYTSAIEALSMSPLFVAEFEKHVAKLVSIEPNYYNYTPFHSSAAANYKFDCTPTTSLDDEWDQQDEATSVHRLRPQDVKVVAALGDSITAGFGLAAHTPVGLVVENRGRSWSIGGDESLERSVTLPNILRRFSPKVRGYNTGNVLYLLAKEGDGLNVAVSGAQAQDMVVQARRLVDRLRADKVIDFEKDWKVATFFIGGNDVCAYCDDKEGNAPAKYIQEIVDALDILYKEVPRMFVNLVTVLKVDELKLLNEGLICKELHHLGCKCAAYPGSHEAEEELRELVKAYQTLTRRLVESGRYDSRDDFTVVEQPLFKNFNVPYLPDGDVDLSLFAPDCFHFSSKGHAAAAIGLWNNMLQPVGKKQEFSSPTDKLICPTKEHPYFYTSKNSN